jgi:hypothetical protein
MRSRKNTYKFIVISFFLVLGIFASCKESCGQNLKYKTQSLFIYKFSKHITWPDEWNKGKFIIGVYGNSPIYEELQVMASIKKAGNNQDIKVKLIKSTEEIEHVHILYIPSSRSRELQSILEKVKNSPTLVVSERGGLAKKGASINFLIMESGILRFEINLEVLRKHLLEIAPELLKLGYKVG